MEETVKTKLRRPATTRAKTALTKVAGAQVPKPRKSAARGKSKKGETPARPVKPKKPKLVRDSFTIPKDEYEVLAQLKQRCLKQERECKKSELLRAGIKALAAMSDKDLLLALQTLTVIKTGRPKKT